MMCFTCLVKALVFTAQGPPVPPLPLPAHPTPPLALLPAHPGADAADVADTAAGAADVSAPALAADVRTSISAPTPSFLPLPFRSTEAL